MKMQAPANVAHLEIDNVKYTPDEDGVVVIDNPAHVAAARRHKFRPYDPNRPTADAPTLAPIASEFDEAMAAKDAEIAELRRQLAEKSAGEQAPASDATDTAEDADDASGDTSESAGDTTDTEDKMGAALAAKPNFDEMNRDQMVEWLEGVGVVVPANISTAKAREAIDEAVADYQSGKKD